jgi:hypothetical protein
VDRDYVAPQLTLRETIVAGSHLILDTLFILLVVGIPVLFANLFSPTFPPRYKLGNVLGLLVLLSVPTALVALLVWLI